MPLTVEYRPLADLVPYIRNSRVHDEAQIASLAGSIREFGWTQPILVDGDNGIIAGHARALAARKLGLDTVPVIELAHLSEAQKRAYVIADNKLTELGGWDDKLLRIEIMDLDAAGFDLGLTGFGPDELGDLLLAGDAAESGRDRAAANAVIQYNIIFDDDDQQQTWFGLLRRLRAEYGELPTIGARLAAWIADTTPPLADAAD
jgi:ParB-like chromosome segregation protein Spo0J